MKIIIVAVLGAGALLGQAPQMPSSGTLQTTRVDANTAFTSLYNLIPTQTLATMAGLYEHPLTFSAPFSRATNTISLLTWGSGSRVVAANALGVSGNCMSWGAAGAADAGAPCGAGGSSVWSALTSPSGALSLTMGANATTFTYNSTTGAIDGLKVVDGASNTGTGILGHFTTASGSVMNPWQADANGVGWRVANDGSMQPVGQAAAGAITLQRGTGTVALALQGSTAGEWRIIPPANFTSWDFTPPTAACTTNQWLTTNTSGIGSCTQPAFTNISGSVANAQLPTTALSGVLKYTAGVPTAIGVSSTDCVHPDGSSGACPGGGGGTAFAPGCFFDGGGSTITNNSICYTRMRFTCTLDTSYSILATGSSPTMTLDVFKVAAGTALPTSSIIASSAPALATGNARVGTTVWTSAAVTADDMLGIKITAVSAATSAEVRFKCQ